MSHVPADRSLSGWIRELIAADKVARFYWTVEWQEMRKQVLEDNHWECARCRERGVYTQANTVHHVLELKARPDLALSRKYRDAQGWHEQLVPLCKSCHNEIHDRVFDGSRYRKPQLNEERW